MSEVLTNSGLERLEIPMMMLNSSLYKTSVVNLNHRASSMSLKVIDCPGIDDGIIYAESATIIMQYPLGSPFTCIVCGRDGVITKRQIIERIRAAYRQQYKLIKISNDERSGVLNSHPLRNLFIDAVFYNKGSSTIIANVDGIESIVDNYPF